MITKASERAGGQDLATHLLNAFDNEEIEIADLRGSIAPDLHGAFAEWQAHSTGTRCKKYLYSMAVSPDHRDKDIPPQLYFDYLNRVEKEFGLEHQPRAVLFHVKNGRHHCHAVYSRIDTDKMRAVPFSQDYMRRHRLSLEFARDHNLTLPDGMKRSGPDYASRKKRENFGEKQQQERSGIAKAERMKAITQAWQGSDSGRTFVKALESAGYLLCQGTRSARRDKPVYTVVDRAGETHPLARQIEGVTTAQLRQRLIDFPVENLPDAKQAQAHARQKLAEHVKGKFNAAHAESLAQRRQRHLAVKAQRRAALNAKRDELVFRHHAERAALRQLQQAQNQGILQQRMAREKKGLLRFLQRVTGLQLIQTQLHKRADIKRIEEHRKQVAELSARHDREKQDLDRQGRNLKSMELREQRSLTTALRKEELALKPEPVREQDTAGSLDAGSLADAFRERAAKKDAASKDTGRDRDPGRERER